MTLRELLKDKTLPVRISAIKSQTIFSVICIGKHLAFIQQVNGSSDFEGNTSLESVDYELYQEPKPKKKMYGYLSVSSGYQSSGYNYHCALFRDSDGVIPGHYRAPWLDGEVE